MVVATDKTAERNSAKYECLNRSCYKNFDRNYSVVFSNMISDLFRQNTTHVYSSLIHRRRRVSVLASHSQTSTSHIDMVHSVRVYIMGSHTVYKLLFILKSSAKYIGPCILNIYVKTPISA
jgi:hypothetical protein